MGSCEGGCELVLGGFSQGAAAATVAGIDLLHYKPDVIMFASPPSILESSPCKASDQLNFYGFVNTNHIGYDLVPNQPLRPFGEKFIGDVFLLDDYLNFPISRPANRQVRRLPSNPFLHTMGQYAERIHAIANDGCFPFPVALWPNGHYCYYDDECASNYCVKKRCKEGL